MERLRVHLFAIVLALVAFFGCHPTEWEKSDRSVAGDTEGLTFRPLGDFDVPGSERYIGSGEAESAARLQLLDSVMDHVERIRDIIDTDAGWDDRSLRILDVMNSREVSLHQAWFVDQLGASMALEKMVQDVESTESLSSRTAVKSFVEVLVNHGSPNAPLIADGLDLLRGYIPMAEVRALAARAAKDASAYLERCPNCDQAGFKSNSARPQEYVEYRMIAAGRSRLLNIAAS